MKTYLRIVLLFTFIITSLGFVGPFLISAESTPAVIGGVLYLFIVFPLLSFKLGQKIFKEKKNNE